MEEIEINIGEIKSFVQKVLGEISMRFPKIRINTDYYWEIPIVDKFSVNKPSSKNITLGSINEDLEDIKQEMRLEKEMIDWWDCELLSRIFMTIGNELLVRKEEK